MGENCIKYWTTYFGIIVRIGSKQNRITLIRPWTFKLNVCEGLIICFKIKITEIKNNIKFKNWSKVIIERLKNNLNLILTNTLWLVCIIHSNPGITIIYFYHTFLSQVNWITKYCNIKGFNKINKHQLLCLNNLLYERCSILAGV